ncbi:hypothetical protein B5V01_08170 [Mesorhizobium erdmanii]|uniref:Uncharacterized protein n=2 Tax=Mesorhizobium TaxID=68287 RepID=A0A3M9X4D8_9HYPH|nr:MULTISPECIES: hypothetical protein [Mesorhizobium]RNJ42390.1 hypothetical protein DNR46_28755 [Mesorhizobium japonicum]RXT47928.1 hypothetical protein B5V01_08170 [Mesorhizobium erdmanii]
MYEMLLDADLVIANISTSNLDAMFELGVRHALRPRSTIAESQFKSPFDVNHIVNRKYTHLGPDIGYAEAGRMQKALKALMAAIGESKKPDSPIYSLLGLTPPTRPAAAAAAPGKSANAVADASPASEETHAALWAEATAARAAGDFEKEKAVLSLIYDKQIAREGEQAARPRVLRELAFCTYKLGDRQLKTDPDAAATAYEEAIALLHGRTRFPHPAGLLHRHQSRLSVRSPGQHQQRRPEDSRPGLCRSRAQTRGCRS